MIRVLFVARYRDAMMRRKVEYLAQQQELEVRFIYPASWSDEYGDIDSSLDSSYGNLALKHIPTRLWGRPNDPHRAVYQTLCFGLRSFQPDIFHVEEEPDSLGALHAAVARRLWYPRAKLLLHTWQNVDRPKGVHVHGLIKATLRAADAVFCANQEAAVLLRNYGYSRPTPLIPAVGVDTDIFRPCPEQQVAPKLLTIGYIGRFVPEKGIDTLLAAVARLQSVNSRCNWQLRLIGAGPAQASLEKLAQEYAIAERVEWTQSMSSAQIAAALCAVDVVVLPSRTTQVWKEQLGRILLEAMASGVPVIGSNSGAIPEVVGDAGLIFHEGDHEALAAQLQRLADDPQFAKQLRERGIQRAQTVYSQRQLAIATYEFYRTILRDTSDS